MTDLSVKRTLVKSPPELWSEVSEVESLARHLGELGEISISRIEPEHTVAWEGERASGTVEIEASGWGTKVTLTAETAETSDLRPQTSDPEPEPEPELPPVMSGSRAGVFSRWFFRQRTEPLAAEPEPEPPAAEPEPESTADEDQLIAVLESTLDSLGSAHHRPFSRG